jgi:hypothetical protein
MANETARDLLDEFNNGGWDDIKVYFSDDLNLFLDYLSKYGLDGEIDYDNVDDDYKNLLLLSKLEKNPTETLKYICDNIITDVYPMDGGYYLYLRDRTELAVLFDNSGRDTTPRNVAENVLGEDYWEPYWDTTDDVYRDVIDDLNEENKNHLANYIVKNIGDQELPLDDYEDALFHQFSEEQGTEGVFKITSENVMKFIKDEEAMKEMFKKDLDELKSELYSIHNNAYNGAYTDEIYNNVWNELSEYFEPKSWKYNEKESYDGKKIQQEYIKINNFYQDIYDFLSNNKTPQWREQYLGYAESYCGFIEGMMDDGQKEWLSFRIPDYADWTYVKKNINEIFTDYVG